MAHKAGLAKSPIETKTAVKGILVGLAVMALTIVLPLALSNCGGSGGGDSPSGDNGNAQPPAAVDSRGLPVSAAPVLYFEQGQRSVTVTLRHDMWSREIVIPETVADCDINVEPRRGYQILFKDGTLQEVPPEEEQLEVPVVEVRRAVFRILGNVPGQTATVTISHQPR